MNSKSDQELLTGYPSVFSINVKWGDMDAMRHLNNTRYFYYCESARLDFLTALFPRLSSLDPSELEAGFALAYTDCKFKVPVTFPDRVVISTAVTDIKESEFTLKHAIYSTKMSLIAAENHARLVHYDFQQGKRVPMNEQILAILEAHRLAAS